MKLIDLSQPVYDGCPNCPFHPRVDIRITAKHPDDGWHMEHMSFASHTGSHIDAPLHKLPNAPAIDSFPLESFTGPAWCADLMGVTAGHGIGADDLEKTASGLSQGSILLLATGWGDRRKAGHEWHFNSPYLTPEGARWLVERGARGVGIDHYSIGGSRDPENSETHTILLEGGLWILEELRFPEEIFHVPQPWDLWCLPVNFPGASGAFCRPVVRVEYLS